MHERDNDLDDPKIERSHHLERIQHYEKKLEEELHRLDFAQF